MTHFAVSTLHPSKALLRPLYNSKARLGEAGTNNRTNGTLRIAPYYRPCRRALKREIRAGAAVAVAAADLLSNTELTGLAELGFSTTASRKAWAWAVDGDAASLLGTAEPTAGGLSRAPGVATEGVRAGRFSPPSRKPFFHWGPRDGLAAAQHVQVAGGGEGGGRAVKGVFHTKSPRASQILVSNSTIKQRCPGHAIRTK